MFRIISYPLMTKIINGGEAMIGNQIFGDMKNSKITKLQTFFFLAIIIICCSHSNLSAQNQVLTKQNGGMTWQPAVGGTNIRAERGTNQAIASGVTTTVQFLSEEYDVNNDFDGWTSVFTPPQAGYYVIKASVNWSSVNTTTGIRSIRLVRNGTTIVERGDETGSGNMHSSIHTVIYSDGTDNYRIQVHQSSGSNHSILGSSTPGGQTTFTAFSLFPYNQNVLQEQGGGLSFETGTATNVRAVRTTSQSIASFGSADVTYTSEEFDLNNDFNPTTGIFTPPQAGYYVILASVNWANSTNNGTRSIRLWRNGSTVTEQNSERGTGLMNASLHTLIYSDGTDNYRIGVWNGSSGSQNIDQASFAAYRIGEPNQEIVTQINGGVSIDNNGTPTRIRAKRTSNMSVAMGTNARVTYSSEDFDVNSEFNPSTGVFTPSQAGYYAIMATANWDASNSNTGERGIRLIKRIGAASTIQEKANYELGSSIMTSSLHTVVYYDGTSGHTYYIEASQSTSASHNIGGTSGAPACTFTVYKL